MGRKSKLYKAGVTVLTFNLLLQIAAVASPGWLIVVKGNTESFHSIFYVVTCDTLDGATCKGLSLYEKHEANHELLGTRHVDFKNEDNLKHERTMQQVLLLSAIACTLGAVFLHVCRRDHDKRHAHIISTTIALCGLSAGISVTVASLFIVQNADISSSLKSDARFTHRYVGFPYSLTMMLTSVLVHLASMIILANQLNDPKEKKEKEKRTTDIAYIDFENDKGAPSPPGVTKVTTKDTKETDGYESYRL
ncbi:uncharacterized protein LOC127866426 [Dreissena polymorpha]|uniref:Uncharacterized protein n=1 Tax=Dreissena polymorpha TaxID=45954 RepID=A0A9D4RDW7_DREPO|nr:uncharacterized protein LOC127866426 [Dreissena polymorpha]KAH3863087.1 hypothetical protein DPMN_026065 [Dreissena polymorpha]